MFSKNLLPRNIKIDKEIEFLTFLDENLDFFFIQIALYPFSLTTFVRNSPETINYHQTQKREKERQTKSKKKKNKNKECTEVITKTDLNTNLVRFALNCHFYYDTVTLFLFWRNYSFLSLFRFVSSCLNSKIYNLETRVLILLLQTIASSRFSRTVPDSVRQILTDFFFFFQFFHLVNKQKVEKNCVFFFGSWQNSQCYDEFFVSPN